MASNQQVAELRDYTAVTESEFTNVALSEIIDDKGSVYLAAASIWRRKAAGAAALVDTSEEGSSRSMSQLYKQATEQVAYFEGLAAGEAAVATRTRATTRPIERV